MPSRTASKPATTRGDNAVETAIKIVEIDLRVGQLIDQVTEVKVTQKEMLGTLTTIVEAQAHFRGLLDLVNVNAARSDERWKELQANRTTDQAGWGTWRDTVDDTLTAQRTIHRMLAGGLALIVAGAVTVGGYYITDARAERSINAAQISANRAEQSAAILAIRAEVTERLNVNSGRLRVLESHAARQDPTFVPAPGAN